MRSRPQSEKLWTLRKLSSHFGFWLLCLNLAAASATAQIVSSGTDEHPNEYFTINEGPTKGLNNPSFTKPLELISEGAEKFVMAVRGPISAVPLTNWTLHNSSPQMPGTAYNRKLQFGTWVNDPTDSVCYNTRAKVLIRDSKVPVTFKPTNKCVVDSGGWDDPYTGKRFASARDIQIDHVVPLKHAYQTGAWKWNYQTRCLYANFTANTYHLLSVNGHENMAKGDKSPDEYIPPNPQVTCGYLQIWLQIKLAWGLVIFPNEAEGIKNIFAAHHCDANQFKMDQNELARQRRAMTEMLQLCKNPPPPKVPSTTTTSDLEEGSPFSEAETL